MLGFGGMRFDPAEKTLAVHAVLRAAEFGINYFDTAPGYCADKSEGFIGEALAQLEPEKQSTIHISTKSTIFQDKTADDVRRRIEGQLKKLRRDTITFYNIWCILDLPHFTRVMAPGGPYEGVLAAHREGLVEHICCTSHASGEDIAVIAEAGVFESITLGYNILNHFFREEGIRAAAGAGMGVVTMNPLGGGMLTRDEERLSVLKEDEGDSFIAAALRFTLSHPDVTIVLSGMKNAGEVEANVRTANSVSGADPEVVERIKRKFFSLGESFCTGCTYCLEHCPEGIQIHLYAQLWDRVRMKLGEEAKRVYGVYRSEDQRWLKGKRAASCTGCGECEKYCTQKLPLREYMSRIAEFLGEDCG